MSSGREGTFGQRGVSTAASVETMSMAEPDDYAGEPDERQPGLLASLFGIGSGEDDEFDIRLSEEYAPGKTLWLIIPLWLFFGGFGAHRWYVGHFKIGFAILAVNLFMTFMVFSAVFSTIMSIYFGQSYDVAALESAFIPAIVLGLWILGDGIYVIVRKLRPM